MALHPQGRHALLIAQGVGRRLDAVGRQHQHPVRAFGGGAAGGLRRGRGVEVAGGAGAAVTTREIVEHCRKSAAVYKVPRFIDVVNSSEVPLTHTGKPHKQRLREMLSERYLASRPA